MNLVLFDMAMEHISKISRIIERPGGNGLLIGVGGSGKQSLTKLSIFLLGMELDTIVVTNVFTMNDLKSFLSEIFKKATKPPGTKRVFMITDNQIRNDEILVFINDMLSSAYVPGLWPRDELEAHLSTLKNEAKANGIADTPETIF